MSPNFQDVLKFIARSAALWAALFISTPSRADELSIERNSYEHICGTLEDLIAYVEKKPGANIKAHGKWSEGYRFIFYVFDGGIGFVEETADGSLFPWCATYSRGVRDYKLHLGVFGTTSFADIRADLLGEGAKKSGPR